MDNFWILAQADANAPSRIGPEPGGSDSEAITKVPGGADPNTLPGQPAPRGFGWQQMLPFILIFVVMYMFMLRGPRKRQQEHRQMVQTLKKNDRVRTIGGILGTVVDVKGDEVVLKVDESNNTKIRVSTSAIGRNLTTEEESKS